ncbi:MAG: HPF/RaiA family ribosome-associated protein [Actinomycetes bacterium]
MTTSSTVRQLAPEDVQVTLRGEIPLGVTEYVQEKVAHATRVSGRPVHRASVVVQPTAASDDARRFRVEATVDLAGTAVRAEAYGAKAREATDEVVDLLRRRITSTVDRWEQRSRWLGVPEPGRWRHGMLSRQPQRFADVPADDREIVRRKTFALDPLTPDEAAFDMEALGHDFLLFVDAGTGREAVVHTAPDGTYAVVGGASSTPPVLEEEQARQRLDVGGEPFVFFLDARAGRGRVVYRRYDGHYGVIEPADG